MNVLELDRSWTQPSTGREFNQSLIVAWDIENYGEDADGHRGMPQLLIDDIIETGDWSEIDPDNMTHEDCLKYNKLPLTDDFINIRIGEERGIY